MEVSKDEKGSFVREGNIKYYHADNDGSRERAKLRVAEMIKTMPAEVETIKTPDDPTNYKHKLVFSDESTAEEKSVDKTIKFLKDAEKPKKKKRKWRKKDQ